MPSDAGSELWSADAAALVPAASSDGIVRRAIIERALRRGTGGLKASLNAVTLLVDGPDVFAQWLADIAGARHYVLLENYIFSGDRIGTRIVEALLAAAQRGVAVFVLYDWLGTLATSAEQWARLRRAGVFVRAFSPFDLVAPLRFFRRNHRKVLCIDGVIGHVGGLCIGDAWAGDAQKDVPPWHDLAVRVVGAAAAELRAAFDETWRLAGSPLPDHILPGPPVSRLGAARAAPQAEVYVMAGLPDLSRLYRLLHVLLSSVRERLYITDAYFLAPPAIYEALISAARDGVDVRVLLPGRSDLPWVAWASRAGLLGLLQAGVRIFEWRGPMLHAKAFVVDGRICRVGSSNMNLSSLIGNWEMDLIIADRALSEIVERQFLQDQQQATELVLALPKRRRHRPGSPQRMVVRARPPSSPADLPVPPRTGGTSKDKAPTSLPPGARMAQAGAMVLGATLRRRYEQTALSLPIVAGLFLLFLAGGAALWPQAASLLGAVLAAWLGGTLLLRAGLSLLGTMPNKRRRPKADPERRS
jgi:cardiolipin synthase